jgi:DNA-directed RNA polymerase subunit RPC12/RpoP
MWLNMFHTVYFCPQCKIQRTWSRKFLSSFWVCDHCGKKLIFSPIDNALIEPINQESPCIICKHKHECEWFDDLNFQYCPIIESAGLEKEGLKHE